MKKMRVLSLPALILISFFTTNAATDAPGFEKQAQSLIDTCASLFAANFLGENNYLGEDATKFIKENFEQLCEYDCPVWGKINDRYKIEQLGAKKFALLRYVFKNLSSFFTDKYYAGVVKDRMHPYLSQMVTKIVAAVYDQSECLHQIELIFDYISGQHWLNKQIDMVVLGACLMHVYFDLLWGVRDCVSAKIATPEERVGFCEMIESADISRETQNLWNNVTEACCLM